MEGWTHNPSNQLNIRYNQHEHVFYARHVATYVATLPPEGGGGGRSKSKDTTL